MRRWLTDTEPSGRYPLTSRANAGEVYPDPMSPLSATLAMLVHGEAGWRDAYVDAGSFEPSEFEPHTTNAIACHGGYLYINMSVTRIYGVRMPGMTPEMVDLTYFGDMPGIRPYAEEARPTDESAANTAKLEVFLRDRIFGVGELHELREDRARVRRLIDGRPDLDALDDAELVDQLRSLGVEFRRLFCRHILVSSGAGIGIGTLAGVCEAIGRPELPMTLIAGLGGVDSALPSVDLWALSRSARTGPVAEAFDAGPDDLEDRLRRSPDAAATVFVAELDEFLERHGARGPNEWELRADTWGTRPALALALVASMRAAPDEDAPDRSAAVRAEQRLAAADEVRAALGGDAEALGTFEAGLRVAVLFNAGRERSKTTCIQLVHEMRQAARCLGDRLAERGDLAEPRHVFMALDAELDRLVTSGDSMRAELAEREEAYDSLFDLEPPFVVDGAPPPLDEWAHRGAREVRPLGAGDQIVGIPGCAGTVTGTARIVTDLSDPAALTPGDILVAPVTDPAWTPLFVPAGGVVVDVGAQITHAVIVSRELGIPCVVSATDATRRIPDGATVTVDGTTGTVTVDSVPTRGPTPV